MKFIFNNKEYPSIDGVKKAYYGIPAPPGPDYTEPFYVEDVSGADNNIYIKCQNNYSPSNTYEKSYDGVNWESVGTTGRWVTLSIQVPANSRVYLRSTKTSGKLGDSNGYMYFSSDSYYNVGGNIFSLMNPNYSGVSSRTVMAYKLFNNSIYLKSAKKLWLCDGVIPSNAYNSMFWGCTALIDAPDLPSTTVYSGSGTGEDSYGNMFRDCTSLTTAPDLPSERITTRTYSAMFDGCTSLNSVKCLATNLPANSTGYWLSDVSPTGTFYKKAGVEWPSGVSGIPEGWTVVEV